MEKRPPGILTLWTGRAPGRWPISPGPQAPGVRDALAPRLRSRPRGRVREVVTRRRRPHDRGGSMLDLLARTLGIGATSRKALRSTVSRYFLFRFLVCQLDCLPVIIQERYSAQRERAMGWYYWVMWQPEK